MASRLQKASLWAALTLGLAGCGASIEGGLEITLVLALEPVPARLANGAHAVVEVEEGYLTTWSVELVACETVKHGVSAPTVIAEPAIEALASSTDAESLRAHGTFRPAPGAYCAARVFVRAADEDAADVGETAMLGVTLAWSGTADGERWSARTSAAYGHDVHFAEPVSVAADERWTLTLRRSPAEWLEGVDLLCGDPDALGRTLVAAALDGASATLEPAP
jgi:hypothetical protein